MSEDRGVERLDAVLASLAAAERRSRPTPSATLEARVLAEAMAAQRRAAPSDARSGGRPAASRTAPALAFALSLVFGFALGFAEIMPTETGGQVQAQIEDETDVAVDVVFGGDAPF